MTTNHARGWRQIAATAIAAGTMAVGALALTAPAANAQKPTNFQGFKQCAEAAVKRGESGQAAAFDCCLVWNGTWTGGTYPQGYCSWPDGDMDSVPDRAVPSGTVILPPDAEQTQLGTTPPQPPTANPHPGSNTRAGIQ